VIITYVQKQEEAKALARSYAFLSAYMFMSNMPDFSKPLMNVPQAHAFPPAWQGDDRVCRLPIFKHDYFQFHKQSGTKQFPLPPVCTHEWAFLIFLGILGFLIWAKAHLSSNIFLLYFTETNGIF
jgi:hypothetical protein